MDANDLKGVRLPGSVAAGVRGSFVTPAEQLGREVIRANFLDALADYIDARIDYRNGDPEWKTAHEIDRTSGKLEDALSDVLRHGV